MIDTSSIPVVDFTEHITVRLISTAYIDEPALAPLIDDEDELAILEEIEGLTSARRGFIEVVPVGVNPEELLTAAHGYGWTYINAAFCYTRATGNRFNGPERGAWYATYGENAVETSKSEVSWHLTREFDATGIYENLTMYRELIAGFTTQFHDVYGYAKEAFLNDDPKLAYGPGQALARGVIMSKGNGIVYPSCRMKGGNCLVAFRPIIVQNVRQGDTWEFNWAGARAPTISKASS